VVEEHPLDLGGVHVGAARHDQVLVPIDQVEEAVLVEVADVAEREPVIAPGCRGGFRRPVIAESAVRVPPVHRADLAGG
jgi:hypothetical protein